MSRGTIYVDTNGKRVEVCRGIGEPAVYIVARISKTGAKHRVKSPRLEPCSDARALQHALDKYAPEKGWKPVESKPDSAGSAKVHPVRFSPAKAIGNALTTYKVDFDAAFAKSEECLPLLHQVADAIDENLVTLDRNETYIGLRVGVCLEIAKQLVKHGAFERWRDGVFDAWGERQLQYYHSLARVFLKQHKDLLPHAQSDRKLLTAEDVDPAEIVPTQLEAPAKEFIGGKTLADLLDEHGIKKRPTGKTRGGDQGGGETRSQQWANPEAHRRDMAMADLREIANDMAEPISRLRKYLLESKRQAYLPMEVIEEARTAYTHYRLDLKDCLDALKQVKG